MNSDRDTGILAFTIKGKYKITVDGTIEERSGIICKEFNVNKASCNIAADMDQLLIVGFGAIQRKVEETKKTKKVLKEEEEEEEKEKKFYDNPSPSEKDVKERADQLRLMFRMQKEVKITEIISLFEELMAEGKVVEMEGSKPMYGQTWDSMENEDRLDIIFRYITFFVNPLQSLQSMGTQGKEEKK